MGYSSRYHVASLAAVFLALGVGILIGTGLNGVVSDTTKSLETSLRGEIESSQNRADDLERQLANERDLAASFGQAAFPGLVRGLLSDRRVAVITLGESDGDTREAIGQVVGPSAVTGGRVQDYLVVREPPDLGGLADDLRGRRLGAFQVRGLAQGGDALSTVAKHAGRALVNGGGLFKAIEQTLLKQETGAVAGVEAVIVTRQEPDSLDPAQADATATLEAGLLDGLRSTGLPVVGVETSVADPSSISLFSDHDVTSVDNVDEVAGRVSLAYGLAGAHGAFGVKPSAERLMPPLRSPGKGPARAARTRAKPGTTR